MSDGRLSATAAYVAAFLAFAPAAVTAYWLLGGTVLLDTVGGELERLARSRSTDALLLTLTVVAVKVAAGLGALALKRRPSRRWANLAVVGGSLLALYGAVLTLAGALVLIGAISSPPTDDHALRWHVLFWDPWFLIWGLPGDRGRHRPGSDDVAPVPARQSRIARMSRTKPSTTAAVLIPTTKMRAMIVTISRSGRLTIGTPLMSFE